MRLFLLVWMMCLTIVPVSAAPLTDYDFGNVAIDVGVIAPQVSVTYETGSGALLSKYGSNYGVNFAATLGIGQPFALRIHGDFPLAGNDQNQTTRLRPPARFYRYARHRRSKSHWRHSHQKVGGLSLC